MGVLTKRYQLFSFSLILTITLTLLVAAAPPVYAQTGAVEGAVVDDDTGDSLPGVNIVVVGTSQGAATDADGRYRIEGVAPGTYTLRASFIGYDEAVRQGVQVQANQTTTVNFSMQQQATDLDEVVVVGYGTQQRRDLTGSVSSVTPSDIEAAQPETVDEALQGQVAGVQVVQNSNAPGGGISVRIRGQSSITAGSEPLYVIDGVPVYSDNSELDPTGGASDTPSPNALAFLNPGDIASIEVLKDASAKAIYGARGSNGVVMIQTKRGQAGGQQVNFQTTIGLKTPAKTIDVLNATEHARVSNEILQVSRGTDLRAFNNPDALGVGTDWQDLVYDNALSQSYSLSVGGGDQTTTYYISGSYSDGESIVRETDTERLSVRASVESQPYDFLRVGGNVSGSRVSNRLAQLEGGARNAESVAMASLQMWPYFPARFEDGSCPLMDVHDVAVADNFLDTFNGSGRNTENPVCGLEGTNDRYRQDRALATLFAEISLVEGLTIETRGGADLSNVRRQSFFDRSTRTGGLGTGGQAILGNVERTNLSLDVIPRYSPTFLPDWQSLDVTSGFSLQQEILEARNGQNSDFPTDVTGFNDIGAGAQSGGANIGSNKVQSTMVSGFGRVNYQLFNRYLFTGTIRGDGSSRFGANSRWGIFPSAALAWRISEEAFMPDLFTDLKLRVSWGVSGNQEIAEFAQFSSFGNAQYNFDGELVGGLAPSGLGNANLGWEETTEWDVGLDVAFLDGQVSATVDWFHQDTQDLLLNVDLPLETGFGSAVQNVGGLQNTGVEVSLSTSFMPFEGFHWRQRFNWTRVRNEVTSLGPNEVIFGGTFNGDGGFGGGENGNAVIVGQPIGAFWGWETDGIFRTQEEADAWTVQPNAVAGERRFVDHNSDGQITQEDKHVIGDPNPDFTFGWSNTFRYESVSLDVFLQGSVGNDIYNTTFQELGGGMASGVGVSHNIFKERVEGAWTPDNRDAKWPRLATAPGEGTVISTPKGPLVDAWLQDGSYLRAESITLTWNIADQFTLPWTAVRNASLFLGIKNAFTITGYDGVDPDVNTEGQDNIRQGIDLSALPLSRTYQVGFRLGL